jgi:uncharacterized protein with PQ loop repeat
MDKMFLSFGLVGSIISISGSFPMLIHLVKVKDSTGQSLTAWYIWMLSNFFLLAYAVYINEPVFMFLQFLWVIMTPFGFPVVPEVYKINARLFSSVLFPSVSKPFLPGALNYQGRRSPPGGRRETAARRP